MIIFSLCCTNEETCTEYYPVLIGICEATFKVKPYILFLSVVRSVW